jgi:hypothetical protein
MAKTNFSGPITTGRNQDNSPEHVRDAQFLVNGASFYMAFGYWNKTLDTDRLATAVNNPIGTVTMTLESVAGTSVSGLDQGGVVPATEVSLTSTADDSGATMTITGTDCNGYTQSEDLTEPNAGVVYSAKQYQTVTSMVSDTAAVGALSAGVRVAGKTSWPLRSLFNQIPGSAAGGAAETATSASKNLANNIVIPAQSRILTLSMMNHTAYSAGGFDVEFGSNLTQAGGSLTDSMDDNYFTTTVDAKAVGEWTIGGAGGGTALPQAVALVPQQLNVCNGDTAGFPGEKILVMTAANDAGLTTGVSVVQCTWLQKNNGTN